MPDAGWQELERSWRSAPGDQDLLARAITSRRRVGQTVPYDMLQARRLPPRTFASDFPFQVWVESAEGEIDVVGRTGRDAVSVPAHKTWWVEPAASCEDLGELVDALGEAEVPGLALSQAVIGSQVLEVLAELPGLERLSLLQCRGLDAGSLTSLVRFPALCELALVYCPGVDDHALKVIGQLTRLVELNLAGASISDEGVLRLDALSELAALNLSSAVFGDRGLQVLGRLPQLRDLRAQACEVSGAGLEALGAAARLRTLELDASHLVGEDLTALGAWPELGQLGLERCEGLGADAWPHLLRTPGLGALSLDQASGLNDAGLEHLADLAKLEELVISGAPITADGLGRLARVSALTSLILSDCPKLARGDLVLGLGRLCHLQTLSLADCPGLDWEAVDEVRRALPECQVEWI